MVLSLMQTLSGHKRTANASVPPSSSYGSSHLDGRSRSGSTSGPGLAVGSGLGVSTSPSKQNALSAASRRGAAFVANAANGVIGSVPKKSKAVKQKSKAKSRLGGLGLVGKNSRAEDSEEEWEIGAASTAASIIGPGSHGPGVLVPMPPLPNKPIVGPDISVSRPRANTNPLTEHPSNVNQSPTQHPRHFTLNPFAGIPMVRGGSSKSYKKDHHVVQDDIADVIIIDEQSSSRYANAEANLNLGLERGFSAPARTTRTQTGLPVPTIANPDDNVGPTANASSSSPKQGRQPPYLKLSFEPEREGTGSFNPFAGYHLWKSQSSLGLGMDSKGKGKAIVIASTSPKLNSHLDDATNQRVSAWANASAVANATTDEVVKDGKEAGKKRSSDSSQAPSVPSKSPTLEQRLRLAQQLHQHPQQQREQQQQPQASTGKPGRELNLADVRRPSSSKSGGISHTSKSPLTPSILRSPVLSSPASGKVSRGPSAIAGAAQLAHTSSFNASASSISSGPGTKRRGAPAPIQIQIPGNAQNHPSHHQLPPSSSTLSSWSSGVPSASAISVNPPYGKVRVATSSGSALRHAHSASGAIRGTIDTADKPGSTEANNTGRNQVRGHNAPDATGADHDGSRGTGADVDRLMATAAEGSDQNENLDDHDDDHEDHSVDLEHAFSQSNAQRYHVINSRYLSNNSQNTSPRKRNDVEDDSNAGDGRGNKNGLMNMRNDMFEGDLTTASDPRVHVYGAGRNRKVSTMTESDRASAISGLTLARAAFADSFPDVVNGLEDQNLDLERSLSVGSSTLHAFGYGLGGYTSSNVPSARHSVRNSAGGDGPSANSPIGSGGRRKSSQHGKRTPSQRRRSRRNNKIRQDSATLPKDAMQWPLWQDMGSARPSSELDSRSSYAISVSRRSSGVSAKGDNIGTPRSANALVPPVPPLPPQLQSPLSNKSFGPGLSPLSLTSGGGPLSATAPRVSRIIEVPTPLNSASSVSGPRTPQTAGSNAAPVQAILQTKKMGEPTEKDNPTSDTSSKAQPEQMRELSKSIPPANLSVESFLEELEFKFVAMINSAPGGLEDADWINVEPEPEPEDDKKSTKSKKRLSSRSSVDLRRKRELGGSGTIGRGHAPSAYTFAQTGDREGNRGRSGVFSIYSRGSGSRPPSIRSTSSRSKSRRRGTLVNGSAASVISSSKASSSRKPRGKTNALIRYISTNLTDFNPLAIPLRKLVDHKSVFSPPGRGPPMRSPQLSLVPVGPDHDSNQSPKTPNSFSDDPHSPGLPVVLHSTASRLYRDSTQSTRQTVPMSPPQEGGSWYTTPNAQDTFNDDNVPRSPDPSDDSHARATQDLKGSLQAESASSNQDEKRPSSGVMKQPYLLHRPGHTQTFPESPNASSPISSPIGSPPRLAIQTLPKGYKGPIPTIIVPPPPPLMPTLHSIMPPVRLRLPTSELPGIATDNTKPGEKAEDSKLSGSPDSKKSLGTPGPSSRSTSPPISPLQPPPTPPPSTPPSPSPEPQCPSPNVVVQYPSYPISVPVIDPAPGSRKNTTRIRPPGPLGPRRPSRRSTVNGASPAGFNPKPSISSLRTAANADSEAAGSTVPSVITEEVSVPQKTSRDSISIDFQPHPLKWKGYTFEAAQWTFTKEELQTVVSQAIRQSASSHSIRLLHPDVMNRELPDACDSLEGLLADAKVSYKAQVRRRRMLLHSLTSLTNNPSPSDLASVQNTIEELNEVSNSCDKLCEEIYQFSDQLAQIQKLRDTSFGSALAIALRKLNNSFLQTSREIHMLQEQLHATRAERDEAWDAAQRFAQEMEDMNDKFDSMSNPGDANSPHQTPLPITPEASGSDAPHSTTRNSHHSSRSGRSSRVSLARRTSERVTKAGLRSSSRSHSMRSSVMSMLVNVPTSARTTFSSDYVPPVPPIPSRRGPLNVTIDNTDRISTGPVSATMLSPEMIAMHQAHLDVLEMLGMSSRTHESYHTHSRPQSAIIIPHGNLTTEQSEYPSPPDSNQHHQSKSDPQIRLHNDEPDHLNLIRSDSVPFQSRKSHREAILTGTSLMTLHDLTPAPF